MPALCSGPLTIDLLECLHSTGLSGQRSGEYELPPLSVWGSVRLEQHQRLASGRPPESRAHLDYIAHHRRMTEALVFRFVSVRIVFLHHAPTRSMCFASSTTCKRESQLVNGYYR